MEVLGVRQFADCYRGKRVLVTGHTGFKGSWLSLWLQHLGADLVGVSLPSEGTDSHWDLLQLPMDDRRSDIRDYDALQSIVDETRPEVIFHLAAQSLVRRSYQAPRETWSTNVMGTVNVLEACRQQPDVQAVVVVTTDKCYENKEWPWGYRENDRLGGHDPYSASKAGAELVASSYRSAFFQTAAAPLLATARAGNVIGGGDWSDDRLIPDLIRSLERDQSLEIRSPDATRPWQHVLDSLSGYLLLGQRLLMGEDSFAEAWNFGPEPSSNRSVSNVLGQLSQQWKDLRWHLTQTPQPHEANLLHLDSAKARSKLGWRPVWGFETAVGKTADWYRGWLESENIHSQDQLADYISAAAEAELGWTLE